MKFRSNVTPTASAISSSSATIKLSLFSFALKFCGVVPNCLANSAKLIFCLTHNTFTYSDIVIFTPPYHVSDVSLILFCQSSHLDTCTVILHNQTQDLTHELNYDD